MNLKDLEFTAERLANATLFGEGEREALKTARDLIAALRAANNLPADFQARLTEEQKKAIAYES